MTSSRWRADGAEHLPIDVSRGRVICPNSSPTSPPVGHKFSIGVCDSDRIVGVAMIGRPVARHYDDDWTLEVNRTCTDGTVNANSMLYGAAWRAAKAMGYRRLITYTRADESGTSLKAAGWRVIAERRPRSGWNSPSRPRVDTTDYSVQRTLWEAN
jgi:hypothetical protein